MMMRSLRVFFAVLMGIVLSQEPEFLQQYAQRLGGALGEIEREIKGSADAARDLGLSLDQAIARRLASSDPLVVGDGHRLAARIDRARGLRRQYDLIVEGTAWQRLGLFLFGLDLDLAGETLALYVPAVPVSLEGVSALAVGLVAGWLVALIVPWGVGVVWRRRRTRNGIGTEKPANP